MKDIHLYSRQPEEDKHGRAKIHNHHYPGNKIYVQVTQ